MRANAHTNRNWDSLYGLAVFFFFKYFVYVEKVYSPISSLQLRLIIFVYVCRVQQFKHHKHGK